MKENWRLLQTIYVCSGLAVILCLMLLSASTCKAGDPSFRIGSVMVMQGCSK